jgi:transcriptional regulator of nitric oxide reductase
VLVTLDDALQLAFPDAKTSRETLFLSDEERREIEVLCGQELPGGLATRFVARGDQGEVQGYAYVDTHVVRTLPETVMVVIDPSGAVRRVEVVSFREPLDYVPREGWYRQFDGEELDDDLQLKRDIRPVTGATLTARATTDAVRRVLAIHQVAEKGTNR